MAATIPLCEAHTDQQIHTGSGPILLVIAFLVLFGGSPPARAQQAAPYTVPPAPPDETLELLKDSLFDLNQEIQLLQHFLEAATVDTRNLRGTALRAWKINNPALRDSLFSVFVQIDSSIQAEAGAEAAALGTAENDLVEVRFGNVVFKGITLKEAIDRSGDRNLYRKVASSYRYSPDIELRDPEIRLPTPYYPLFMDIDRLAPVFAPGPLREAAGPLGIAAELSLTGLAVQAGPHWGGELRLGFNEAGFPFWTSGTFQLLASYDRLKFGAALPLRGGRYGAPLFSPFTIRPRPLNGGPGIVASGDFGLIGVDVAFFRMTPEDLVSLTNPSRFHYLAGFAILYSSFGISLDRNSFARAKLGAGVRRITHARVVPGVPDVPGGPVPDALGITGQSTAVAPFVSFEYATRAESENIRAGVQFFDFAISFFGSLDVIPGVLSIEARYLWPVAPSVREWENPDFLLVTPKLRLTF